MTFLYLYFFLCFRICRAIFLLHTYKWNSVTNYTDCVQNSPTDLEPNSTSYLTCCPVPWQSANCKHNLLKSVTEVHLYVCRKNIGCRNITAKNQQKKSNSNLDINYPVNLNLIAFIIKRSFFPFLFPNQSEKCQYNQIPQQANDEKI